MVPVHGGLRLEDSIDEEVTAKEHVVDTPADLTTALAKTAFLPVGVFGAVMALVLPNSFGRQQLFRSTGKACPSVDSSCACRLSL